MINLKSLSNSDPRRKEIMALASEYKKAQRAYRELKKREGDTSKEVDRIRDELRERTNKLQAKEEKERRSGKEYKGRKKKGLDKARQRSRETQRMYEDSTLMLRRLQAEVKETAVRLNEKGNMVAAGPLRYPAHPENSHNVTFASLLSTSSGNCGRTGEDPRSCPPYLRANHSRMDHPLRPCPQ